MSHRKFCSLVVVLTIFAFQASAQDHRFQNTNLPPEVRATDLVSHMTLEEKASQMVNHANAIPRLGIPAYNWWNEALHGVISSGITEFPEPIGLAATFDPSAIQDMAHAIGIEGRIKYAEVIKKTGGSSGMLQGLDFWAPNVNIFRDPRWGRGQETYGEDPFLSARMGVAFVKGLQGDDPHYYLAIATPKHFAVHSGPEPSRHRDNVDVSKHDELDTYLPAFRAAITEGKAASIMCAYNRINGEPACASQFLLGDQLRGKWGFSGYVVSDCGAVSDISEQHHYVKTLPEAAGIAVKRGMDNECHTSGNPKDYEPKDWVNAVKQGYLPQADLDQALVRLFTARIRMGMFDPADMVPYSKIDSKELDSPAHRALALHLANESMVLLKNDGVLPIAQPGKKILLVGPLAAQTKWLLGNYNGHSTHTVSILDGMNAEFGKQNVTYMPGTTYLEQATESVAAAAFSTATGNGLHVTYIYKTKPDGDATGGAPKTVTVDGGQVDAVSFEHLSLPKQAPTAGKLDSVQWHGKLNIAKSGYYNIGIASHGRGEVKIEGKHLAGTPGWDPTLARLGRIYLEAGKPVDIDVEYGLPDEGKPHAELVWVQPYTERLAQAIDAAKNSDVIVAVVGITSDLEGEEMPVDEPGFKGGDRTTIDLPKPEQELVQGLASAGKPLVLVLTNGSALAVNQESKRASAVLDAFYPGEEGGAAIAETLSGKNNPAGRLPITFYTGIDQLPAFSDYSMKARTYRYFTGKPLYPFGYGLSYTTFRYDDVRLDRKTLHAGETLTADVSITNTGKVAGDEVAQLYLAFPKIDGAPLLALRGFRRVHLAPGETRKVSFQLSPRDLSLVTAAGDPTVAEGHYDLFVGGAQPIDATAGAHSGFDIQGSLRIPE